MSIGKDPTQISEEERKQFQSQYTNDLYPGSKTSPAGMVSVLVSDDPSTQIKSSTLTNPSLTDPATYNAANNPTTTLSPTTTTVPDNATTTASSGCVDVPGTCDDVPWMKAASTEDAGFTVSPRHCFTDISDFGFRNLES